MASNICFEIGYFFRWPLPQRGSSKIIANLPFTWTFYRRLAKSRAVET